MDTLIDAFGHIWQYGSWIIAVILVVFGLLAKGFSAVSL